jgi:hypothetical protein
MIHFGVPSYGIHVNGYVANPQTHRPEFIWVAKRSMSKATYPGMFDQVSASFFFQKKMSHANLKLCQANPKRPRPCTHIDTHIDPFSLPHTHKSEFTHACVRVRVCERWRGWVLTSVFFFYTFVCLRACVRAKVVAGGQPAGLSFMENCAKGI